MSKKEKYRLICKRCGEAFMSENSGAVFCQNCRSAIEGKFGKKQEVALTHKEARKAKR